MKRSKYDIFFFQKITFFYRTIFVIFAQNSFFFYKIMQIKKLQEKIIKKNLNKACHTPGCTRTDCGFARCGSFSHRSNTVLTALGAPMADFARPAAATTAAAATTLAPECGVQVNQDVFGTEKWVAPQNIRLPQKTERATRLCPKI